MADIRPTERQAMWAAAAQTEAQHGLPAHRFPAALAAGEVHAPAVLADLS